MIKVDINALFNVLEDIFTEDGRFTFQKLSYKTQYNYEQLIEKLEWFDALRETVAIDIYENKNVLEGIHPTVAEKINELKDNSLYELHLKGYRFAYVETNAQPLRMKATTDGRITNLKLENRSVHSVLIGIGVISDLLEFELNKEKESDTTYIDLIIVVVNQIGDYVGVSVGGGIIKVGILPTFGKSIEEENEIITIPLDYSIGFKIYNVIDNVIKDRISRYAKKN